MKKTIALLVGLMLGVGMANAATHEVGSYTALESALSAATAGDEININQNITFTNNLTTSISKDISIFGNGNTLDGNSAFTAFSIDSGGKLTINNLSINNFGTTSGRGGAIFNIGTLTTYNSSF